AEYQTGFDADALLAREPDLARARLVMPGLEYAVGAAARLAARLPGDMITALISIGYEFGFIDAYLRVLRGERPALPTRPTG
ncbi:hypothetical protein BSA16_34275, partial [Micromonospora sp. Rc5]